MINNRCIFEGNIANDVKIDISQSGKKVVTNQLMVRDGKDQNGKNKYQYVSFAAYEAKAEFIGSYMRKGTAAIIETHYNSYKGRDGQYKHIFIVDEVGFCAKDYEQKPAEPVVEDNSRTTYARDYQYDDQLPF